MTDPASALDIDFPHLSEEPDRHGNMRLYARRYGRRVRIREVMGTPEFANAYAAAMVRLDRLRQPRQVAAIVKAKRNTLGWLAQRYYDSDEFRALDAESQTTRRRVIDSCLDETVREASPDLMRDCPIPFFNAKKIKRLRDLKSGKPGAANNRKKYISAMFGWAVENEPLVTSNPARDVRRVKYVSQGFLPWTLEWVMQFRARHPIGTRPRLALEMLLFIGCRRGDFVKLGRQHLGERTAPDGTRERYMRFVPRKTRHMRVDALEIPVLPYLQSVIDATPAGDLTFLVTEYGAPFTAKGFGGWFAERCNEAGVPARAHGLRKIGATLAAEMDATVPMLMAMYGWSTAGQAIIYIKAANQKKLARKNAALLARGMNDEQNLVSPPASAVVAP